jgi:hypothetical protein
VQQIATYSITSSARAGPDAGVPRRPRPAPDTDANLLKLPPPQIIFCAATPAPGLRPLVWVNAPLRRVMNRSAEPMWYRKNVGAWERAARLIGGGLMLICGVIALHASPLGLLLSGAGVMTLITGVFGYCPACAIAGRKPLKG